MQFTVRLFTTRDIDFAAEQTRREGWDSTPELFEILLAHDPGGCFIAEEEGERVGLVTTTVYERTAWIGNLIVPPECRKRGIGMRLMTHAMAEVSRRGIRTVRLEADPPGIRLYRSLGFSDEFESLRFRREAADRMNHAPANPLLDANLPEVAAFDTQYFGDDRGRLLGLLLEHAVAAYWLQIDDRVRGYAIALTSACGLRIGPWVAEGVEAARAVLEPILAKASGKAITLGRPNRNPEAARLLTSLEFHPTPSSRRMVYGKARAYGKPDCLYAIGSGAFG